MENAPRLTRRRLLTAALVGAALTFERARAQTTADPGCTLGFVNGLLQYSPDCALLTPPGLGAEVAPPSHLVSLAAAVDGATGTTTEGSTPQSGSRRQRAKQRQHQQHKWRLNRRHRRHKLSMNRRHRRHKNRHKRQR